jgi:hypothetical protein
MRQLNILINGAKPGMYNMGMKKDVSYKGITLGYHELFFRTEDFKNNHTSMIIASYINKNAWQNNPEDVFKTWQFEWSSSGNNKNQCYTYLKTLPEWSDATEE